MHACMLEHVHWLWLGCASAVHYTGTVMGWGA